MTQPAMTAEMFQRDTNVSRETLSRLESYIELLRKWQKRINLIARGSVDDIWRRHMLDSAQLARLLPDGAGTVTDLGSGAGFPGLVIAIMADVRAHLIEANTRKTAFLREVARLTGATVEIHNARIEALDPWPTDVVTARALAPLHELLALAEPFLTVQNGAPVCLFLKGARVEEELTQAGKQWSMDIERFTSASGDGTILQVRRVTRGRSGSEKDG